MRKYSTPQIEAILKTFGLNTIKVQGGPKKVWRASENWLNQFKLQNIEIHPIWEHQIKIDITFRDQAGLQRHKKINIDPKVNMLKELNEKQIISILDKISNVSIFSQSFWQIWFASFGGLKKNLILAILKQILGIPFTIQDLAQFTREYSQQALQKVKQSPAMKKILQVFKIKEIQLASFQDRKKSWAVPRIWDQQFTLHNICYIDIESPQRGSVKIQFTIPGSITRSKIVKFVPGTQFKKQPLEKLLQKLTKVRVRGIFSQVFWQLWLTFVEKDANKAKNILKAQLGLTLSQSEQITLQDFKQTKQLGQNEQISIKSQSSFLQPDSDMKSLSQNLKTVRKLAREIRIKAQQDQQEEQLIQ